MLAHTMISDADYTRARIHEMKALRRLIDEAEVALPRARRRRSRQGAGAALIAAGARLQGVTPALADPVPSPKPGH